MGLAKNQIWNSEFFSLKNHSCSFSTTQGKPKKKYGKKPKKYDEFEATLYYTTKTASYF